MIGDLPFPCSCEKSALLSLVGTILPLYRHNIQTDLYSYTFSLYLLIFVYDTNLIVLNTICTQYTLSFITKKSPRPVHNLRLKYTMCICNFSWMACIFPIIPNCFFPILSNCIFSIIPNCISLLYPIVFSLLCQVVFSLLYQIVFSLLYQIVFS